MPARRPFLTWVPLTLLLLFAAIVGGNYLVYRGGGPDSAWPPTSPDSLRVVEFAYPSGKPDPRLLPNIVFAVYDARRFDDFSLGSYGNRRNDTPFLEEIAEDSMFFPRSISPGCWTLPVHAAYFTGFRIFDLQNDYYQPHYNTLPSNIPTLSSLLGGIGYRTIAYADHPFFYSGSVENSLIRDFDLFNVVMDFSDFETLTNVGEPDGTVTRRRSLSQTPFLWRRELDQLRAGVVALDESPDEDPETGVLLPRLWPLFRSSSYFAERYGEDFDSHVFNGERSAEPYFLFLNIHMCCSATPDPQLLGRWRLQLLLLNAEARGRELLAAGPQESFGSFYGRNVEHLGLDFGRLGTRYDQHVFDNRFYDCVFRAVVEYLKERGLFDRTITVATSDHGLSFGEHGEPVTFHGGARPFHEPNVRVPMIVRFPGDSELTRLHGVHERWVSGVDTFYTILDAATGSGAVRETDIARGRSLIQRVEDDDFEEFVIAESSTRPQSYRLKPWHRGEMLAIYRGEQKVMLGHQMRKEPGTEWRELAWYLVNPLNLLAHLLHPEVGYRFDLQQDPHEERNLYGTDEEVDAVFRTKYEELLRARYDLAGLTEGTEATFSQEQLETLRALGYVQ